MVLNKRSFFDILVCLCLLLGSLPTATLFVNRAFNFYYALLFFVLLLFISVIVFSVKQRKFPKCRKTTIFFSIFVGYVLLNGFFFHSEKYYVTGLLSAFLLFLVGNYFICQKNIDKDFYMILTLYSLLEGIYVWFQLFGVIPPLSKDFVASGSFENPNITAIIIAISVPPMLSTKWPKVFKCWLLIFFIGTLLLLKCRTAYITTMFCIIVFAYSRCHVVRNKVVRYRPILTLILILVFAGCIVGVYKLKEESSQGRFFIARNSCLLATKKPIWGCGYGLFEKDFNLFQVEKLQSVDSNENERVRARWVFTAYNEFLEQLVQGGIVGFLLFCLFVISFLKEAIQSKNMTVLCINVSVVITMFFNFLFQAYPLLFVSILLVSFNMSNVKKENSYVEIRGVGVCSKNTFFLQFFIFVLSLFVSVLVGMHATSTAYAQKCLKQYKLTSASMPIINEKIKQLKPLISTSSNYYYDYGVYLFKNKEYKEALLVFEEGKEISSFPGIYLGLYYCYLKTHDYQAAEKSLIYLETLNVKRQN